MPWKPDVTVAAVTEKDGRFLLVEERIHEHLVFNQPAGHVENGETLLQAVIRETREETAWGFEPEALLGIYHWRHPASGKSTLRFAFTGAVFDHCPSQALDEGIIGTHWLTREEIAAYEARLRSPLVLRCIEDYLQNKRLPLDSVAHLDLEAAVKVHTVNILA